ncbi:alpha/beta hydrolase [Phenylobacterium sp. LH3H17]|uniref:alpha/beta fold hydrolase n=1 Tax=Phenylobacterium sp. LH3H17 TaxID=2903901 RepID=UPI0020C9FFB7|nr:alpha/beta hydrolase [Phenylobacterium sp. LH3H17]UTP38755.1 alpha/beta hydrolase [Phenylobacterium sp. LH3H17]
MKLPTALRPARPDASKAVLIAGAVAALAAVAATNQLLAKRSERRHPPRGQVIEVDGVRLHYFEAGTGTPVVLIHGNGVTAEDYVVSGLFHRLAANHRVIAFDRPGFGYTARPRNKIWTASAQAKLIAAALDLLAVKNPVVVAHSWGTLVALRLALQRPDLVAGLGLMSGYYWPTPRLDVPMMSGPAIPVLGDVMRFTVSPLMGRLMAPLAFRHVFSPAKVTQDFKGEFPTSMALRPGQIRASAGDTAMMPLEALSISKLYNELACPILLIAGDGDKIASFKHQSVKFARRTGCELHTVRGAGHMVHHIAPDEVGSALETLIARAEGLPSASSQPRSDAELERTRA